MFNCYNTQSRSDSSNMTATSNNQLSISITILILVLTFSFNAISQNRGLVFNQLNDNYVVVPDNPTLNITNNFSLEFWLVPRKTEAFATILQEGECYGSQQSYFVIQREDTTINFVFNCSGNCNYYNEYKCDTKLRLGDCQHIAISYSSDGVKIYIDGLLQPGHYTNGAYCGDLYESPKDFWVGSYRYLNGTTGAYFDGLLDELRIWSKVLTQNEINSNMNNALTGDEIDLLLYYNFDSLTIGDNSIIFNQSNSTGASLNGTTQSSTTSSPFSYGSCFSYEQTYQAEINISDIKIFPNPTTGDLNISGENITQIEIWNSIGRKVFENQTLENETTIDVSDFEKGVYFVRLYSNNEMVTKQFVKE